MSLIEPNLFLSSVSLAKDEKLLKEYKIKFVLIAAKGLKKYFPKMFTYKHLDITDNPGTLIIKHFVDAIEWVYTNKCMSLI
jgi:hypothetical protein